MVMHNRYCRIIRGGGPTSARGFSILEILITLVVMAVIVGFAAPSLQQLSSNNQLISSTNSLVTGLNLARSSAITTGDDVTICPSGDGSSCAVNNWQNGWIIFQDADTDGVADANEILRVESLENAISNSGFIGLIVFESDGTTSMNSNATITSCSTHSNYSEVCMNVVVNQFGTIESSKYESEPVSEPES